MWVCIALCKSNQHKTNEILEYCSLLSLWVLFPAPWIFIVCEMWSRYATYSKFQYQLIQRLWSDWRRPCTPWFKGLNNLPCTASFHMPISLSHHSYSYQGISNEKKHHLSSLPFFCNVIECDFSLSDMCCLKNMYISLYVAIDFKRDKVFYWVHHRFVTSEI